MIDVRVYSSASGCSICHCLLSLSIVDHCKRWPNYVFNPHCHTCSKAQSRVRSSVIESKQQYIICKCILLCHLMFSVNPSARWHSKHIWDMRDRMLNAV